MVPDTAEVAVEFTQNLLPRVHPNPHGFHIIPLPLPLPWQRSLAKTEGKCDMFGEVEMFLLPSQRSEMFQAFSPFPIPLGFSDSFMSSGSYCSTAVHETACPCSFLTTSPTEELMLLQEAAKKQLKLAHKPLISSKLNRFDEDLVFFEDFTIDDAPV